MKSFDFFISYTQADKDLAMQIANVMREFRAKVWFQAEESNQIYPEEIVKGLKGSENFVIILSDATAKSKNVLREFTLAVQMKDRDESFPIIPIVRTGTDLNSSDFDGYAYFLSMLNFIKEEDYADINRLVEKIIHDSKYEISAELKTHLYKTSSKEAERLYMQNRLMQQFTKDVYDSVFEELKTFSAIHILDVGCSDSTGLMMRLEGHSYTTVLGVDKDAAMAGKAHVNFPDDRNTYLAVDVLGENFETIISEYLDGISTDGFELINLSSVLLHIKDPQKLFARLNQFLKKGGFLVIQDEDDGCNFVYPDAQFFQDCFYLYQHSKMSGDRLCGRKIGYYLKDFGMEQIQLRKCGILSAGLDPEYREALWNLYFNPFLWGVVDEGLFDDIKCLKILDTYKQNYYTYKDAYDKGDIVIQLGFFIYVIKK